MLRVVVFVASVYLCWIAYPAVMSVAGPALQTLGPMGIRAVVCLVMGIVAVKSLEK